MSFDINQWLAELTQALRHTFGTRLQAVGIQGSFARGEESPSSDIDAVVILDHITPQDIAAYKNLLTQLPAAQHPVCGFFGGKEDLKNWSRAELFQFTQDTRLVCGTLEGILPPPSRQDALLAAKTGAGTVYHALVHTWIHGELSAPFIKELCKASFFMLQAAHFIRTGHYPHSKKALLEKASNPAEQAILQAALAHDLPQNPQALAQQLLTCSQEILRLA